MKKTILNQIRNNPMNATLKNTIVNIAAIILTAIIVLSDISSNHEKSFKLQNQILKVQEYNQEKLDTLNDKIFDAKLKLSDLNMMLNTIAVNQTSSRGVLKVLTSEIKATEENKAYASDLENAYQMDLLKTQKAMAIVNDELTNLKTEKQETMNNIIKTKNLMVSIRNGVLWRKTKLSEKEKQLFELMKNQMSNKKGD